MDYITIQKTTDTEGTNNGVSFEKISSHVVSKEEGKKLTTEDLSLYNMDGLNDNYANMNSSNFWAVCDKVLQEGKVKKVCTEIT